MLSMHKLVAPETTSFTVTFVLYSDLLDGVLFKKKTILTELM